MLFSLIEEQTKTLMLANVRDEYVFSTVDPAVVPELKDKPKRSLIVAVAIVLGGMFGLFGVLIGSALVNSRKASNAALAEK
jgi:LPS O-antigen subunit length determinant protein (WzzB/FepE family)